MADFDYLDLIGPGGEALKQQEQLIANTKTLIDQLTKANNVAKNLEFGAQGAKTLKDVTNLSNQLVDANGKLVQSVGSLDKKWQESITLINQLNGHSKEAVQVKQELVKLSILEERVSQATNKAKATEAKQAELLTNEYGLLSKAYNEASLRAKNYALTLGATHPSTISAIADAKKMGDQLKALDAQTGQHQRNVGNYASAYSGLGFAIRNISGELPNIGISFRTFAQSISNNIGPLTQAIQEAREQNRLLAEEGKATIPIGKQIAASVFSWQTAILALVAAFTAYAPKIQEYIFGTKEASTATDDFSQSLSDLNDKLDFNNNFLDRQIRLRTAQAKARGASAKEINDIEQKGFDDRLEQQEAFINESVDLETYYANTLTKIQGGIQLKTKEGIVLKEEDIQKDLEAARKKTQILIQQKKDIAAQKEIARLSALEPKKGGKAPADFTRAEIKADEDLTTALYDQLKQRSEQNAEVNKQIAEDETNNLDARLQAYEAYTYERLNITGIESAKEQQIIQDKLAKIAEIEAKDPSKRSNAEQSLLLSKQALEVQLTNLTEKFEAERTKIVGDNVKFQEGLMKGLGKDANEATKKAIENLNSINLKGPSTSLKQHEDAAKRRDKLAEDSIQFASELGRLESVLAQKKIDEIDAEISKINEKRDAELAAIDASSMSQQDKDKKSAEVKARYAAEEKKLDDEKRARQRRAAQFEKAITISQIIAETALATVRALGSFPFTPANIALAAGVGAIGAARLAVAIATPIPQYAKGVDSSPEGPAIVGEKGRELRVNPDGSLEMTPAKATLTYLEKGTKIIPAHQVERMAAMYGLGLPASRSLNQEQGIDLGQVVDGLFGVRQAIERKPVQSTSYTWQGVLIQAKIGGSTTYRVGNQKH